MERRDFIKSVGIAGIFSLLGTVPSLGLSNLSTGPEKSRPELLSGPFAVVFDPSGNLLVTDPSQYRVVCLDSNDKLLFLVRQARFSTGYVELSIRIGNGIRGDHLCGRFQ